MNELRNDLPYLLKSGYKSQKDAKRDMNKRGYNYDDELSSMNTKVFEKDGKPIILHRGTQNLYDIVDDGLLAVGLGKYGFRYKNAQRVTKKVEEKYKQKSDAIGHSYGGWLAENSNNHGNIITYNKAVGLGDINTKHGSRQLDVSTDGDLVSGLGISQNTNNEYISNKSLFKNAYTAHNVDNLFGNRE